MTDFRTFDRGAPIVGPDMLVESGNASALAQAILLLIENEELRLAMGEAGRERAEKYFSWEMVAESMLNRYEEVMKSHA